MTKSDRMDIFDISIFSFYSTKHNFNVAGLNWGLVTLYSVPVFLLDFLWELSLIFHPLKWLNMKDCHKIDCGIHGWQTMCRIDFGDLVTFPLAPLRG